MSIIEKAIEKAKLAETSEDISVVKKNKSTELNKESNLNLQDYENDEIFKFDWEKLETYGFINPKKSHDQISEEFRSIKRPLVMNALNGEERGIERANLILITSSIPGEGKSFTSINLAISIAAERDKQVLLIDADVAKPSVSKNLGIRRGPGLIEYLEGAVKFSDIVIQTEIPGLRIIPAGKTHRFSTELLASNKMGEMAKELSERYSDRIVIFDSPPLLAATQAEVLSHLTGQVILVIEAEKTPQTIVMESVKKLEKCDVVLALLNKTNRSLDMYYYGYGKY